MDKISKRTKVLALLVVAIIVAGVIVTCTVGLNFDLRYQEAKKIQLYLEKDFAIEDIKQITNEVLPNQNVILQKVEVFEDTVSILANDITEEQKANIITKVNEKYGTQLSAENITITNVPHTRGRDIIKPYIVPFSIATIVILVYMAIRYYKIGMLQVLAKTVTLLVLAQAILLSVMAIARIPIGRVTIPLVLAVYVLSLMGLTSYFEKGLTKKKKEEEK